MAVINSSHVNAHNKLTFSHLYWGWNAGNTRMQGDADDYYQPTISSNNYEHVSLVPVLATILLLATVFLLVVFRQSPALVAGTVAASLTIICIYLTLSSIQSNYAKYE